MSHLLSCLFGPLAVPECRRALSRGWLFVLRLAVASVVALAVLTVTWVCWLDERLGLDPRGMDDLFRGALVTIEGLAVTVAVVMTPAVLAGRLAGESERGALGLLLTTPVRSSEIVTGRLVGRLAQVGLILLASLPGVVWLASLASLGPGTQLALAALPLALAFGGGGLAMAASVLSRRGRDALLLVYFLDLVFLVGPALGRLARLSGAVGWLLELSPYRPLGPLAFSNDPMPALRTMAVWIALGLAGLTVASWALRPACLGLHDGGSRRLLSRRPWRVPAVDGERPMLWKEFYIERASTLGRAGRWLGLFIVVVAGGGSLVLAALAGWFRWVQPETAWTGWAIGQMDRGIVQTTVPFTWLIHWAIGLRAAVIIAAEREKGTWDALLTSPLRGAEIVLAKLGGTLYGLRWLIGAVVTAWTVALGWGVMTPAEYASQLASLLIGGAFMAAVGVRASLQAATATRAMALSIGAWLAGGIILFCAAFLIVALGATALDYLLGTASAMTVMRVTGPAFQITYHLLYVLATAALVVETALRFDRIAGRMTAGRAALVVDRIVHGLALAPVWMGPPGSSPAPPSADPEALRLASRG